MKNAQSRPINGFTLIELLVVVAIIAILAGILLPALGKAKASARKVKCIAQMREVAIAVNQFAYDHKNRYPGPSNLKELANDLDYADLGGEKGTHRTWANLSDVTDRPLFQYIETLDIFECPGDRGNASPRAENVFEDSGSSYFYPVDDPRTTDMGIEFVEDNKLTSFTALSKKVIIFEPTLFYYGDETIRNHAKAKWHTDLRASVLGFGDGHAALTEEDDNPDGTKPPPKLTVPQNADERASRDYY
jgi:prepilin-type N-terminal cleavage/methylation domain-containing protein